MKPHSLIVPTAAAAFLLAGCQSSPPATAGEQISGSPAESRSSAAEATAASDDRTATIWVKGVACPFCVTNIERQLVQIPGVERVWVDLPMGKVWVTLEVERPATREQLVRAIDDSGFTLDRVEMPR